jgi:hypothetical protein
MLQRLGTIMEPEPGNPDEVEGTGMDRRDDLGLPDRFAVYHGMADSRIGVARLDMPERLPAQVSAKRALNREKARPATSEAFRRSLQA